MTNIVGVPRNNPLKYTGPKDNIIPIRDFPRRPTTADRNYALGQFVLLGNNPATGTVGELWYLKDFSSGLPQWQLVSGGGGGGGMSWTTVTGTSQAMLPNNGYVASNGSLITLTLPVSANVGDLITIMGLGTGLFKVAQNAGQQIVIPPSTSTTIGATGYIQSDDQYGSVTLICIQTNTIFSILPVSYSIKIA